MLKPAKQLSLSIRAHGVFNRKPWGHRFSGQGSVLPVGRCLCRQSQAETSGSILTVSTRAPRRHTRESGYPERSTPTPLRPWAPLSRATKMGRRSRLFDLYHYRSARVGAIIGLSLGPTANLYAAFALTGRRKAPRSASRVRQGSTNRTSNASPIADRASVSPSPTHATIASFEPSHQCPVINPASVSANKWNI